MATAVDTLSTANETGHPLGEVLTEIDFHGRTAQVIRLAHSGFDGCERLAGALLENHRVPGVLENVKSTIAGCLQSIRCPLMRTLGEKLLETVFGDHLLGRFQSGVENEPEIPDQILSKLIANGQVLAVVVENEVVALQAAAEIYHDTYPDPVYSGSNVYELPDVTVLDGTQVNGENLVLKRLICQLVLDQDPDAVFVHLLKRGRALEEFRDSGWLSVRLQEDDGVAAVLRETHEDWEELAEEGYRAVWRGKDVIN